MGCLTSLCNSDFLKHTHFFSRSYYSNNILLFMQSCKKWLTKPSQSTSEKHPAVLSLPLVTSLQNFSQSHKSFQCLAATSERHTSLLFSPPHESQRGDKGSSGFQRRRQCSRRASAVLQMTLSRQTRSACNTSSPSHIHLSSLPCWSAGCSASPHCPSSSRLFSFPITVRFSPLHSAASLKTPANSFISFLFVCWGSGWRAEKLKEQRCIHSQGETPAK